MTFENIQPFFHALQVITLVSAEALKLTLRNYEVEKYYFSVFKVQVGTQVICEYCFAYNHGRQYFHHGNNGCLTLHPVVKLPER